MFASPKAKLPSNEDATGHRPTFHERQLEMTEDEDGTWKPFQPHQENNTWDQQMDNFDCDDFPAQPPYTGYFQNTCTISGHSSINSLYQASYKLSHEVQHNAHRAITSPPELWQNMNFFKKVSPILRADYAPWNANTHGICNECIRSQLGVEDFNHRQVMATRYLQLQDTESSSVMPVIYVENRSIFERMATGDTHIETRGTSTENMYGVESTTDNVDQYDISCSDASSNSMWWPNMHEMGGSQSLHCDDGLPRQRWDQHSLEDSNAPGSITPNDEAYWPKVLGPNTISPKLLSLSDVGTPLALSRSSSVSTRVSELGSSESKEDNRFNYPSPESFTIAELQPRRPLRTILPNSGLHRHVLLIAHSGDSASGHTSRSAPRCSSKSLNRVKQMQNMLRPTVHKQIAPKLANTLQQPVLTPKVMRYRNARDEFLVQSKLAGMSYKEIREKGNFTEAESTLRGRFRTLTKHKAERVRKPEWNDNDIRLLRKAVRELTNGSSPTKNKVPWKQVAGCISENGGSYHFGNATCRKKWDELERRS